MLIKSHIDNYEGDDDVIDDDGDDDVEQYEFRKFCASLDIQIHVRKSFPLDSGSSGNYSNHDWLSKRTFDNFVICRL